MKRLATAAIGAPIALGAVFWLPPRWFFLLCTLVIGWGAVELVALVRRPLPGAPILALVGFVPVLAALFAWCFAAGPAGPGAGPVLLLLGLLLSVGSGAIALASAAPLVERASAAAVVMSASVYFALPIASIARLQAVDPWLLFLLLAIVWPGDAAAYYVGSAIGRRKLAPIVSPNKTWAGASAALVMALISVAAWSYWRLGGVEPGLLAVGFATSMAAQLGDLLESLVKRAVAAKDSGHVLPGHGGMLDRMDALLLASPVFLAGVTLLRMDGGLL